MNHLFIQTAFLGDLLLSIPSLKQIRYWSPQSTITLVCRQGYGSLVKELGVCDQVIEVDKKNKKDLAQQLQDTNFDTIFCPHQSMTSHHLVKALKADRKVGYSRTWNKSYFTNRVNRDLTWPEAMRQLQLVATVSESVGLKMEAFAQKTDSIPQWAEMNLSNLSWSEPSLQKLAEKKARGFKAHEPYICIAPGSVWETKRWGEQAFVRTGIELARENYQILIIGAPDERELCERVQNGIPNSYSMAGQLTVLESMMFLSRAQGLICNDSGAMHMASVMHRPTVAVFGPTVQELGYKPWNPKAIVVEEKRLLCRPCGQHGGNFCPIGNHRCMQDIPFQAVVEKALVLFR